MKNSAYQYVTERIIASLEKGVVPWVKPFVSGTSAPTNFVTKKKYRGINLFLLGMLEFSSPYWMTLNQSRKIGAKLRKGSKSNIVVFYKTLEYKKEAGSDDVKRIPFLQYYNVFNIEQFDDVTIPEMKQIDFVPIKKAEEVVLYMPNRPNISHTAEKACYIPFRDRVDMPPKNRFLSIEDYYATLFHELVHSTGHKDRLNRFDENAGASIFGSESYSKEELIAEMGAAFLCHQVGITNVIDKNASYISSWKSRLAGDNTLVVKAANQAQKAVDLILNIKAAEKEQEQEQEQKEAA